MEGYPLPAFILKPSQGRPHMLAELLQHKGSALDLINHSLY